MKLITIPISHYCDRARWALDHVGVAYREERHVQLVHMIAVKRAGGRRSVPVLVTPDEVLNDSADIVRFADTQASPDRRLYPQGEKLRAEIEALERTFAGGYGVATRVVAYHFLLPHSEWLPFNNEGVPRWEDRFATLGFPIIKRVLARLLRVDDANAVRARDRIARTMDETAERLSDGRRYLFGDRFTAADLTFAAMSAPMVLPPEYGTALPDVAQMPEPLAASVRAAREHPAGAFVMRLYAQERRAS